MPLFMCRDCGCIENTALSDYWWKKLHGKRLVCSECDEVTKAWHRQFPKTSAVGMLVDSDGFLWSKEEKPPKHVEIIGEVKGPQQ